MSIVGDRIREAREAAKMSRAELARVLGTSPAYLARVEAGAVIPGFTRAAEIARLFGVSLDSLTAPNVAAPLSSAPVPPRRRGHSSNQRKGETK